MCVCACACARVAVGERVRKRESSGSKKGLFALHLKPIVNTIWKQQKNNLLPPHADPCQTALSFHCHCVFCTQFFVWLCIVHTVGFFISSWQHTERRCWPAGQKEQASYLYRFRFSLVKMGKKTFRVPILHNNLSLVSKLYTPSVSEVVTTSH